ncbi:unnamed protein product [Ectocarpus sp. 12 AP-2014]
MGERVVVFLVVNCAGVCVLPPSLFFSLRNIFAPISRLLMFLLLMVVLLLVLVAVLLMLLSLLRLLWTDPALRAIANPRAPPEGGRGGCIARAYKNIWKTE